MSPPRCDSGFKVCSSCEETKPTDNFAGREKGRYRRTCRTCDKARHLAWRNANRDKWLVTANAWRAANPEPMAAMNDRRHVKARGKRAEGRAKRGQRALTEPRNTPEGRICSNCHERRPWNEFGKNSHSPDGFTCRCTKCAARYRQKNDQRIKAHGLTRDRYDEMVAEQNWKCPICDRSLLQERERGLRMDHIDHDHATGAIRGVLCYHCNIGLGAFHDSPDALRQAAEYIERSLRCQVSQGPVNPDDTLLTARDPLGSSLSSTS